MKTQYIYNWHITLPEDGYAYTKSLAHISLSDVRGIKLELTEMSEVGKINLLVANESGGRLPEYFSAGDGELTRKVPARFHTELDEWMREDRSVTIKFDYRENSEFEEGAMYRVLDNLNNIFTAKAVKDPKNGRYYAQSSESASYKVYLTTVRTCLYLRLNNDLITTIAVYSDMSMVVNGVAREDLKFHITYNVNNRQGRALFVNGLCVHEGYLSKDQISTLEKRFRDSPEVFTAKGESRPYR